MLNTSFKYLLEIACFNIESCLLAQKAGANRIEFCYDYRLGGITPNYEDILKAKQLLDIPLHVIIRPRGGNFVYSASEIETMKQDILFCREHKIAGVVFGALTSNKTIHKSINQELIELSGSMSTTFHRAIDECENIEESISHLISLQFKRVLTAGGKQTAIEGISKLKSLQRNFNHQIIIIPGGGIRSNNITEIINETKCNEFHSAAIINGKINLEEIQKLKSLL